jgi:hypothetical protein
MFRVPVDAEDPTFDRTEKISVRRWLTSGRAERTEWKRRRNVAAATAAAKKVQRAGEAGARRQAAREGAAESHRQVEGQAGQARRWEDRSGFGI